MLRGHTNNARVVIELNYPTLTKVVVDSATASYTSRSHHSSRSLRTQESARLKALEDAARVPDWKEVEDVVCSGSLDQTVKVRATVRAGQLMCGPVDVDALRFLVPSCPPHTGVALAVGQVCAHAPRGHGCVRPDATAQRPVGGGRGHARGDVVELGRGRV